MKLAIYFFKASLSMKGNSCLTDTDLYRRAIAYVDKILKGNEFKLRRLQLVATGAVIVSVLAVCKAAHAQQPKLPRIGFLCAPPATTVAARVDAFRQGLREFGYVDGQNIVIEYRFAEGKLDRLPDLAAELARLNVDVIVAAGGTLAFRAAAKSSRTIPIVMTGAVDPVENGLVASLARPGGNVTGLSLCGFELYGKRFEILKEVAPKVSQLVFLWHRSYSALPSLLEDVQEYAKGLKLRVQSTEVLSPDELETTMRKSLKAGAQALTTAIHPVFIANRKPIIEFAAANRLPAIYYANDFTDDGGLMSYAPVFSDLWRRAASYVDKILKGRKPADLPVEQPMKLEFLVNLKTAKQIGLTIPPNVLVRADRVIR